MILTAKDVLVRAWQRGYSPESVAACLESKVGGLYDVDVDHPAYPKRVVGPKLTKTLREYLGRAEGELGIAIESSPKIATRAGPGTELSKLLKRFGIEPTPTCQCRAKARQMDAWGPDECEKPERIEEVLGVMREEATARGLPFLDVAGRLLIRRAIRNARRAAS